MNKMFVNDRISQLNSFAKENNLRVVFRNRTTNQGDFCIFIYKAEGGRYLVGYDGDWEGLGNSFESCLNQAIKFIESYESN